MADLNTMAVCRGVVMELTVSLSDDVRASLTPSELADVLQTLADAPAHVNLTSSFSYCIHYGNI